MLTRRRFLTISAAAVAASPLSAGAAQVRRWRGVALGASVSMILTGLSRPEAGEVFRAVEAELARQERIFSLFLADSEISRLNRTGRLDHPSADLLEVLRLSGRLHAASGGAFDPTIQPLWQAVAEGREARAAAGAVGWRHVALDGGAVHLTRPGMALTLNGIAQGHVTDRVAALLRRRGLADLLIDMGEIAALGARPDGASWQVGVADPAGRIVRQVALRERAIATSAVRGTLIGGARSHILDPRAPARPPVNALVSVSAQRAAVADGLSTALCLVPRSGAGEVLRHFPGARLEWLS